LFAIFMSGNVLSISSCPVSSLRDALADPPRMGAMEDNLYGILLMKAIIRLQSSLMMMSNRFSESNLVDPIVLRNVKTGKTESLGLISSCKTMALFYQASCSHPTSNSPRSRKEGLHRHSRHLGLDH
jgi:hypothetical protein